MVVGYVASLIPLPHTTTNEVLRSVVVNGLWPRLAINCPFISVDYPSSLKVPYSALNAENATKITKIAELLFVAKKELRRASHVFVATFCSPWGSKNLEEDRTTGPQFQKVPYTSIFRFW